MSAKPTMTAVTSTAAYLLCSECYIIKLVW